MLLHPLSLSSSPPPLSRLRSIQAIGISIWASSQSSGDPDQDQIRLGSGITLAGLAIQLIAFIAFTLLVIWAHRHPRCDAAPACPRLPCGTLAHEPRQSSRPNFCLACAQLNLPFNLRVCARSRAPPSRTHHRNASPPPFRPSLPQQWPHREARHEAPFPGPVPRDGGAVRSQHLPLCGVCAGHGADMAGARGRLRPFRAAGARFLAWLPGRRRELLQLASFPHISLDP